MWYFWSAFVVSFIGSLQPGPVNMSVLTHAAEGHYKSAYHLAIGGCIPEFIFTLVALQITLYQQSTFSQLPGIITALNLIFIGLGLYQLLANHISTRAIHTTRRNDSFFRGLLLAMLNPQLLLFWLGICSWLALHHQTPNGIYEHTCFVIGSFAGALLLQFGLIYLIKKQADNRITFILARYGKPATALMVIGIGIYGLCR